MKGDTAETIIFGQLRSVGYYENEVIDEEVNLDLSKFDSGASFRSAYKFEDVTFNQFFKFFHSHSISHPVRFEFINCTFKTKAYFQNIDSEMDSLYFEDCNMGNEFKVENTKLSNIEMTDCSAQNVHFRNSEIVNVHITNSEITESLELVEFKSIHTSLKNEKKNQKLKQVEINSPDLDLLEIDWASDVGSIKLFVFQNAEINCSINDLTVYEGDFEQLNLGVTSLDKSRRNSRIGKLEIRDIKQEGIIRIEEVYISELILDRIDATNGTYFFNETVVMDTHIESCVFSKFYCNQLFFINNPVILKSDVSSFDLNNLGWTKGKKLKGSEEFKSIPLLYRLRKNQNNVFDGDDIVELRDQKDIYRQLKKASLANKNNIDALQFHANEMQAYWKEVRITGDISLADRILIFLDRWVSNFGQSWHMPLVWLIAVHFVLLMCLYNWQFSWAFDSFETGLGDFFYLLNPAHKSLDFISSGFGRLTEFLMRVSAGFFIFHFIKASRKFGRV